MDKHNEPKEKGMILIVEDDGLIACYIQQLLEGAGYETVVTDSGEAAIRLAQELKPDLALMDIRIKGEMDGVEAVRRIREQADIPHLFLTAHADGNLLQRAKETKPSGYLVKPFRESELLAAIEVALHKHKLDQQQQALNERMQYAQKMHSLGTMAGAMGHHFNNIMMIIQGNAELINTGLESQSPMKPYIQDILNASDRAIKLTAQIVSFAGYFETKPVLLDLSQLIRELTPMLNLSLAEGCEIRCKLPERLELIMAEADQIKQMLIHLVTNAAEAISSEYGVITISVKDIDNNNSDLLSPSVNGNAQISNGYIVLEVADNGCGMDEDTQRRIFDPFFTTKMFGRGLGMSAVLGIVKNHRGVITINSAPQAGAKVTVCLPKTTV